MKHRLCMILGDQIYLQTCVIDQTTLVGSGRLMLLILSQSELIKSGAWLSCVSQWTQYTNLYVTVRHLDIHHFIT